MYIDMELVRGRNLHQKVKVYFNGKILKNVISCKSGANGFVEFYDRIPKLNKARDDVIRHKKRGLVKLSFNLA